MPSCSRNRMAYALSVATLAEIYASTMTTVPAGYARYSVTVAIQLLAFYVKVRCSLALPRRIWSSSWRRSSQVSDPQSPVMYTRENLTVLFKCSHGELGRLLARKMAPLPVRIDGQILWWKDEVQNSTATVLRTLERWKGRR